jgi:hypothetical protein
MTSAPAPTVEELNRLLADSPFLHPYGFRVDSTAVGECTLMVPFHPGARAPGRHRQRHHNDGGPPTSRCGSRS